MRLNQNLTITVTILVFLAFAIFLFYNISLDKTGFAVMEKSFTMPIGNEFSASTEIPVNFTAPPKSAALNGKLIGEGNAKVYLEINGNRQLMLDTSDNSSGMGAITGLVINEPTEPSKNKTSEQKVVSSVERNKIKTYKKSITEILEYNSGTEFDSDDNGIEAETGVIDFSVTSIGFNWATDQSKLCTRWKIDSDTGTSTIICNGAENCCRLIQLTPKDSDWNSQIQLFYGQYGNAVGRHNNVSAQVIYADYNLEASDSTVDVAYSDWQTLPATFLPVSEFKSECKETCSSQANSSEGRIIIELNNTDGNTVFTIGSISYTAKVSKNTPPEYLAIPEIRIPKNSAATINLSQYFKDKDNDLLSFLAESSSNSVIISIMRREIAVIEPKHDFVGATTATLTASDGKSSTSSNKVSITVS